MTPAPVYCVDTSALLDGLERYYFEDAFPGIWVKVAAMVDEGRFFISEEVYEESKKKAGVVKSWCDRHDPGKLIVPTDGAVTREVQAILKRFPRLTMQLQKGRDRADPFVVAVARLRGSVAVTGEGDDGNMSRPKIPYVCGELGVRVRRFTELIRDEGWRFSAQ